MESWNQLHRSKRKPGMRVAGRQGMSSPTTKANPTATIGGVCGLCHLSFVGHQPLLQHLAEHAAAEPPKCRDCRLPQSLIIPALFICSRGCMVTTPAPTYDVPRPTAPEMGAVGGGPDTSRLTTRI